MQKLCNKHRYINKVKTYSNLPEPVIQVAVEAMHKQHEALLDSGADANILPLSLFQILKNKAKVESYECLYNFQKQRVTSHGSAFVTLYIQGVTCKIYFQVVECGEDSIIILGKPWIVQYQCQLNFAKGRILFSLAHKKINLPMGNNTPSHTPQLQPKPTVKPYEPLHQELKSLSKTRALHKPNPYKQPQAHKDLKKSHIH